MNSLDEIANGLTYMGATAKSVWTGDGHLYLLVGWKGKNYLLAKITGRWFNEWVGQKAQVQSLEDAIRVVNCNGCGVKDSEPGAVMTLNDVQSTFP